MKTQLKLDVISEHDLSLIARLLLILNRKQIKVNAVKVESDFSTGYYNHQFHISGDINMLQQARKVIAKQIGVLNIKESNPNLKPKLDMALI